VHFYRRWPFFQGGGNRDEVLFYQFETNKKFIGKYQISKSSGGPSLLPLHPRSNTHDINNFYGLAFKRAHENIVLFVIPAQEIWMVHYPGAYFLLISYTVLRKMWEACVSTTFPDFQRPMEWCQSYFAKCPRKPMNIKLGHSTTLGYLMCSKFCAPYYVNVSVWF